MLRPMNYYLFIIWRLKILQISIHSWGINRKLPKSNQKGLFLDCGSNVGQGFEFFRKYYPNKFYDYVLFEPNPHCFGVLEDKYAALESDGVQLRNVAVGIKNDYINFYGLDREKGGIFSVGGSVLSEHNSKIYTTSNNPSMKVVSIDFAEFVIDLLKKNDYRVVILKLDIEGGEYAVLSSLMSKNLISLFDTIYVEFHSKYMSNQFANEYKNREKAFLRYSRKIKTRVIQWI